MFWVVEDAVVVDWWLLVVAVVVGRWVVATTTVYVWYIGRVLCYKYIILMCCIYYFNVLYTLF